METKINEVEINGVVYVPKSSQPAVSEEALPYVIVRGDRSGIFAGYLEKKEGKEVVLKKCRRIWYWDGAASISQLALDGTCKPELCKFPAPATIRVLDVIEILDVTKKARASIEGVAIWKR